MTSSASKYEGIISLEEAFIKTPLEQYRKAFRAGQKVVERDLLAVLAGQLKELAGQVAKGNKQMGDSLPVILQRLTGLRKKLESSLQEQLLYAERCEVRLKHLDELGTCMGIAAQPATTNAASTATTEGEKKAPALKKEVSSEELAKANAEAVDQSQRQRIWNQNMIDRLLADYMLRKGYFETVRKMISNSPQRENFFDLDMFETSRSIEVSLDSKSCTEALAWCNENKSMLKKRNSSLEFNLRIQEFVEVLRGSPDQSKSGDRHSRQKEAINYAKKYLSPWSDSYMKEIQQAMALVAFSVQTKCQPYSKLYKQSRWTDLKNQFLQEFMALYSLPRSPLLTLKLRVGLSSLKTSMCYQEGNKNANCPVCNNLFSDLARTLPLAHHINSCIVCRISGAIMDEDNPPMMLPNGHVYSYLALKEMADRNDGQVTCPRSNATFGFNELRKCYIS